MYIKQTKHKQTQTFGFVDSGCSVTKVIFNFTRPDGGLHPEDRNNALDEKLMKKNFKKTNKKLKGQGKSEKTTFYIC